MWPRTESTSTTGSPAPTGTAQGCGKPSPPATKATPWSWRNSIGWLGPYQLWEDGRHTSAELAELFGVARSTVYRAIQRAGAPTAKKT